MKNSSLYSVSPLTNERYDDFGDGSQYGCLMALVAILLATAVTVLCGCGSHKTVTNTYRDSIRIETKTVTLYVTDTTYVEIPLQQSERTTADSASHLENDYSVSDARINPDGTLSHSLETKPQSKPVEFQKPIERKDSIVYVEKEVEKEVEVEVEKKLTRWQSFIMRLGTGTFYGGVGALLLFIIYKRIRR